LTTAMSSPTTPPLTLSLSPSPSQSDNSISTSTPSPTQSGNNNNNNGGGPSSSLYLFTFLATLFLLLFVSSAIILRSFVLRRRFRRRIEEAILAGVIAPHQIGRTTRRRAIGEKPKLWEARVFPASDDGWDAIIPVSAQPASTPGEPPNPRTDTIADADVGGGGERRATAAEAVPALVPLPMHHDRPPSPRRRLWLRNPFSRRQQGAPPSLNTPLPPISQPTLTEDSTGQLEKQNALPSSTRHDRLEVTVLITMPNPRRPHPDGLVFTGPTKGKERSLDLDYDDDDLPDMVLGMTELHCTDTITTPKSP